ncbi:hypothetical protein BH11BAC4_BH11BAC4_10680 [soil metagenome]
MSEWYFIAGFILIVFAFNWFLRKRFSSRTNLIISAVSFVVLMIMFLTSLIRNFSWVTLIIVIFYFSMTLFNLVLKYKNLNANT